jgi:hypothetical protein
MIRPVLFAAAVAAVSLAAAPALAKPAVAFECPATLDMAVTSMDGAAELGESASKSKYPVDVFLYEVEDWTVFGIKPTRLWTRYSDDEWGKAWVFIAEVPVSFDTAKAALLRKLGKTACGMPEEPGYCKFERPLVGEHTVLQYVETSSNGQIQFGCEYRQDKEE